MTLPAPPRGIKGTGEWIDSGRVKISEICSGGATETLAKETEHLGIRTMLVEPGAFRTNFYGEGLRGTDSQIPDYDVLASQRQTPGG